MHTLRQFSNDWGPLFAPSVPATRLCYPVLLALALDAVQLAAAHGQSVYDRPGGDRPVAAQDDAAVAVDDVIIAAGGHLQGRVVGGRTAAELAGLHVSFVRGRRTMAATMTGADGRFAVRNLPGGLYRVVVDGAGTPSWRFYRVCAPAAVRPGAHGEIRLPLGDPVVRGQNLAPFPIMSLRQAATVGGIAFGAVAIPAIYHNMLRDNKVPATP